MTGTERLFTLVVLFSLCAPLLNAENQIIQTKRPAPSQDFTHNVELDEYGKYFLYWTFDDNSVTFEVHVRTHGWVGLGMSPNGGMAGSDIVIGWVDQNGQAHLTDRHATGFTKPILDESQDWTLLEGREEGEFTILKFTRKRITCDKDDRDINMDTVRAIFAWHDRDPSSDDDFNQHLSTTRGVKSISIIDYVTLEAGQQPEEVEELKSFEMRVNNVTLPQKTTTYFCRIMKLPEFSEKQHIVRVEPLIDNVAVVHHIITYFCHGRLQQEDYGRICWEGNMPDNATECDVIAHGWAVGQGTFYYPKEAGLSVGSPGDARFFQIEIHYDNPQNLSGLMDSSGFRFFYTNNLRKYDTGTFIIGHGLIFPPMFVPPNAKDYQIHAYCSKSCTNEFPESGIKVFGSFLHTHLKGRRIWTRHFRDGKELPHLGHDYHYDFNYQKFQHFKEPVVVMPADEFHTICEYNTENTDKVVFGGAGTENEMCFNFMSYYPKMPVTSCISVTQDYYTVHQHVMQKAMTGELHIDPKADKSVYEYMEDLKWTESDIQSMQDQLSHMHGFRQFCIKEKSGDGVFGGGNQNTYEKNIEVEEPLKEESVCAETSGSVKCSQSVMLFVIFGLILLLHSF